MIFSKVQKKVKRYLRHSHWTKGCGAQRGEFWDEFCHDRNVESQRSVYRDILSKLNENGCGSSSSVADACSINLNDHQLTEAGKATVTHLLTVVKHAKPDFCSVPVLYPVAELFLNEMNEEEAFVCLMSFLSHCQKYLVQTDVATSATNCTLIELTKKHANRAYTLFQKLTGTTDDKDLLPIVDEWKSWLFRDLPFSHLATIVDCYMHEGQKILFRIALALMNLWCKDKSSKIIDNVFSNKRITCRQIASDMSLFCKDISLPAHKLLKAAFSIRNLKMDDIQRLQQKHEIILKRSDSLSCKSESTFSCNNLPTSSDILTNDQLRSVYDCIPVRFQIQILTKLYSVNTDGTSFINFWAKIEHHAPTIIVIRTSRDEVFGAYCSESWRTHRKWQKLTYFGTGETFLFAFHPSFCQFPWVGCVKSDAEYEENLFQAADALTLLIGGGALSIRNTLCKGTSEHGLTFANPPLSADVEFDIIALEVFGFMDEE